MEMTDYTRDRYEEWLEEQQEEEELREEREFQERLEMEEYFRRHPHG